MKAYKLHDIPIPPPNAPVTVVTMGNIKEIRHKSMDITPSIQKLDKDHYVDLRTGEICNFNHSTTRGKGMGSVAQTLKRLRDTINTNVINPEKVLWITLTYAENMRDCKRLYEDFRRFNQRLTTYHKKHSLPHYEYIVAAEPQGRGAWHMHLLLIYQVKAPFIPNGDLSMVWRNGFTKTTGLKSVDNVGAYFSAYLGDMELSEYMQNESPSMNASVKEVSAQDSTENKNNKYYVKGARLRLYPKGFRMYRRSKGHL